MSFLFDTSAVSEALKPRPDADFAVWLAGLAREEQFTSAVVAGELLAGAHRASSRDKWLARISEEVLPTLVVLPFDLACARAYGELRAHLADVGRPVGDADAMIGATALVHGLTLVTANVRHFSVMPGLTVRPVRLS